MRNIKNIEKLTKEELIVTLLKLESSIAKRNFEKLFNNNTDNDEKIRSKISDIRMIVNRLGNIVTKKYRKDIKKKNFMIWKKRKTFQIKKKKRFIIIFLV